MSTHGRLFTRRHVHIVAGCEFRRWCRHQIDVTMAAIRPAPYVKRGDLPKEVASYYPRQSA
jgi:hypothetical protein